jgi:hypothetical protein
MSIFKSLLLRFMWGKIAEDELRVAIIGLVKQARIQIKAR